ncbi:MAG TPA: sigma-70 family RNA polymerase sigma factor [Rhizomicrobium sp.]|jgi:RNA polymerase sigma-70 factor (ECF subfamily)|nr:sigma-70 family RNA polymerase sigma factor [Rhizomicrobium sp.]
MAMTEAIGARRNTDSFTADMAKLIPALRSMARLLYRNEESAADLAQETLAKAWAARGSFAPGTNLKAWLFTIMRNQFRSEARRNWRQVPWDEQAAERIPGPRGEQIWSIELKDAARAVKSLSKRQREALILAGVGGLSSEEAAAAIRCRPTAVKSRVSRARQAVRLMLDGAAPLKRERDKGDPMTELVGELERIRVTPLLNANGA